MRLPVLCCCLLWVLCPPARGDVAAATRLVGELEQGQHVGIESFIMKTNGEIAARYLAPKLRAELPDLRSATKSITALLIGIAIDRGEIASVQTHIAALLPNYPQLAKDPAKATITIDDLLTMRSGLACDDWNQKSSGHEDKMYRQRDWMAFWASQPMSEAPGKRFSYCTGNVIALGMLLETATHVSVDRYATEHLFGPLGITRAEWARWGKGQHIDTGGHLRLAPDDVLKLGELVLAGGRIADQQLVSRQWIESMTRAYVSIPGYSQHYGYLWWLDQTKSAGLPHTQLWMAQGNGGNMLIVLPGVNTVIVTTGTRFNQQDALEPLFWLRDRLLPAMAADPPGG